MYWVISGKNDNPLVGSILLKDGVSLWDQLQPYLPVLTAIVSLGGIAITYSIAKKAREIAEEQKIIAQDKLDIDIFDKRFKVFQSLTDLYNTLNYAKSSQLTPDLDKKIRECFKDILPAKFLFQQEDAKIIHTIESNVSYAHALILATESFEKECYINGPQDEGGNPTFFTPVQARSLFDRLMKETKSLQTQNFTRIVEKYTPVRLGLPPYKPLAIIAPASHPEPPPAAPEQAQ